MTCNEKCLICNSHPETALHALRECTRAKRIWSLLNVDSVDKDFYSHDLFNWICCNLGADSQENNWSFKTRELITTINIPPLMNSVHSRKATQLINWKFPSSDCMKCNVDGSLKFHPARAACGGVFRDATRSWKLGFVRNVGNATINMIELWGILTALQIAKEKGFQNIWIDRDRFL
ncbi:Ribonuclease H-like superfamily [Sesbania bispinosa]|nr:Ribonuclease H-like superfamily [Sesbania bispinosa]